jgi:hypothetical protein
VGRRSGHGGAARQALQRRARWCVGRDVLAVLAGGRRGGDISRRGRLVVFSGHVLSRIPLVPLRWRVRESVVCRFRGPGPGGGSIRGDAGALCCAVRPNAWDDVDTRKKRRKGATAKCAPLCPRSTTAQRCSRRADEQATVLRLREAMPLAPGVGQTGRCWQQELAMVGYSPVDPGRIRELALIKRHAVAASTASASACRRPESRRQPARIKRLPRLRYPDHPDLPDYPELAAQPDGHAQEMCRNRPRFVSARERQDSQRRLPGWVDGRTVCTAHTSPIAQWAPPGSDVARRAGGESREALLQRGPALSGCQCQY